MDDPSRHRRHNVPLGQHATDARFSSQPSRSIPSSSGSSDRYRPAPINTSPHTPRNTGSSGNYSNYYQEPTSAFSSTNMPPTGMPGYGSGFGHDGRQQSQGFGGYNTAAMMYNVAQTNTQTHVYDAQNFGSRQPAAMQMMAPDVTSTYFGADTANAPAPSLHQPATVSESSASVYQQNASMGYTSNMPSVDTVQQVEGGAEVSTNDDLDFSDGALEEKWRNYQRRLAMVFREIKGGSLNSASETLLSISDWLLSQVVDLGLTVDDANLHADRLKLWNDFNHAWLALGQRQIDIMEPSQSTSSQRPLPKKTLQTMGDEIIRLTDELERHGLVNYEYGVWEDEILAVLTACIKLYPSDDETGS